MKSHCLGYMVGSLSMLCWTWSRSIRGLHSSAQGPERLWIRTAAGTVRQKQTQNKVRCPGAHSGLLNVYYLRHLPALKPKLNGQTSMFQALKEFSLMLMQEKFPSHSCNFIRQSRACPLLKKKKKDIIFFIKDCATLESECI